MRWGDIQQQSLPACGDRMRGLAERGHFFDAPAFPAQDLFKGAFALESSVSA